MNDRTLRTSAVRAIVIAAVATTPAAAAVHTLTAVLGVAQQVPAPTLPTGVAINSPAGLALVHYDDVASTVWWSIAWNIIHTRADVLDIHGPAVPGQVGPQILDIPHSAISGSIITAPPGTPIQPADAANLLAGLCYIDIHTPENPAGETRGQLRIAGTHPLSPILPDPLTSAPGTWSFVGVPGIGWFDPIPAEGFLYQTDGLSNFTSIATPDFLPDNNGTYLITSVHGAFVVPAGATYTFPAPVSNFTLSDILLTVDGEDPAAFPTYLTFDQPTVSFTMTAVPEPAVAFAPTALLATTRRRRAAGHG